ncbi:DUF3857 domain-containing protein [Daejeonella oryzae]|uniref:DUF3857 domain-containing protein n=1 Tax=Daejeonella oryzae TaxID=1122943 RepID=UPI001C65F1AE|nr:DUF3857 domain-containing protein [Daejeonella oryzae]
MKKNLVLALMLVPVMALSQKLTFPADLYKASTIPDSMKTNANSVVRIEESSLEIKSPAKATLSIKKLITLLNSQAAEELTFVYYYDDFRTINEVEIKVYDESGTLDRKYSKKDMRDISANGGSTLVSDNRYLYLEIATPGYPATIEVSYKISSNGLMDYNDWEPQGYEQSVQNSKFTVSLPEAQVLRHKTTNIRIKPSETSVNGLKNYTWTVAGLKALKVEKGSQYWASYPRINMSPADFEIDNVKGNLSSWEEFGRFYYQLSSKQFDLSAVRQQEIREMTAGLKTEREKIEFLYRYMQQNMRYVSIQLGIGGWKPFAASFVDDKKYGDCKALTHYMQSLLQAVNITSYPALINAGENAEKADLMFSNNIFNHVILMVPQPKDTVWLECTSNTALPGKLGTFTENRNALIIQSEGSYLQSTPFSSASANTLEMISDVQLTETGAAKVKLNLNGKGEYRDDMIYSFARQKSEDQKLWLVNSLGLKQADTWSTQHMSEMDEVKRAIIDLEYSKLYEFSAGSKQFYRPRLQKLWQLSLPEDLERKTDYYLNCPVIKTDKTVFHLPEGFEPESLPLSVEKITAAGMYKSNFVYNEEENTVTSTASINIPNQKISVKLYPAAKAFFDEVIKAESRRLIIRKKG